MREGWLGYDPQEQAPRRRAAKAAPGEDATERLPLNKLCLHSDQVSRFGAGPVSQAIAALSDLVLVTGSGRLVEDVAGDVDVLDRLAASAWISQPLHAIFAPSCHPALHRALEEASAEAPASCRLMHAGPGGRVHAIDYSVVAADQEGSVLLLGRLAPEPSYPALFSSGDEQGLADTLLSLVNSAPDAIVVTGGAGGIVWANEAFAALSEVGLASTLRGMPLGGFFDSDDMDIGVALTGVRKRGSVRMLPARFRGALGRETAVELSITALADALPEGCFGIVMRDLSMRAGAASPQDAPGASLEASISENGIASAFGDMSMQGWIRLHVDALEKGCIEAALKLTGQNRAAAARVLGLSRQALYIKMSRHGIVDPD